MAVIGGFPTRVGRYTVRGEIDYLNGANSASYARTREQFNLVIKV
ncbi:hypothetical protein OM076_25250 [Solirubrobacter ginsenosidimutans]|uniref:Uncharacterized protein n=1 Tax=Solirubrobacter ginsenosidimutans TaxID=490573 RepID=A0A9X3S1M6_9ACTN|nr:hypothetical protein [Solirubrobacter ginsenosidimutans]MDA0163605.1 hypothetical protein [Solirubrobacter ginsenosidimutans]